eukprot:scaffold18593_cov162-Skeletonema_marinoi.AAC.1
MLEPCKRCFYTIMANYNELLEAVACHIHSVRYDMAVNRESGGRLRCLIRTPTTVRYDMAVNRESGGRHRCLIRTPIYDVVATPIRANNA